MKSLFAALVLVGCGADSASPADLEGFGGSDSIESAPISSTGGASAVPVVTGGVTVAVSAPLATGGSVSTGGSPTATGGRATGGASTAATGGVAQTKPQPIIDCEAPGWGKICDSSSGTEICAPITCNHYATGGASYCDSTATCVECPISPTLKRAVWLNCDGINENGCETNVAGTDWRCPPKKS
jgi:hypothetical protein